MFTEAATRVLNRNLPRSPRARALCTELAGRTCAVTVDGFGLRILLASDGAHLALVRGSPGRADVEFHGSPLSLLALAGPDPEGVIRRGDVRVDGDAQIAQQFRELLRLLRPDVEEELAQLLGDAAAHRLGRAASGMLGFGRRLVTTGTRNVAEYLAHERADLVPRAEADAFLAGVDHLREDVDRLAARIARLTSPGPP